MQDRPVFDDYFNTKYEVKFEEVAAACAGGNWGDVTLAGERGSGAGRCGCGALSAALLPGSNLVFMVDGKPSFEINAADVSQCANPNKSSDVELQFHEDDTGGGEVRSGCTASLRSA